MVDDAAERRRVLARAAAWRLIRQPDLYGLDRLRQTTAVEVVSGGGYEQKRRRRVLKVTAARVRARDLLWRFRKHRSMGFCDTKPMVWVVRHRNVV